MIPNSLAMLTDSEIISVQALITDLRQQSNIPIELQAEFHKLGTMLTADPDSMSQAIKTSIELVKSDLCPSFQAAYQSARLDLQSNNNNNRKSKVDYSDAAGNNVNSQEIRNQFRDELLIAGNDRVTTSTVSAKNPVAKFVDRLLGKK
jgi:hypothetical protein